MQVGPRQALVPMHGPCKHVCHADMRRMCNACPLAAAGRMRCPVRACCCMPVAAVAWHAGKLRRQQCHVSLALTSQMHHADKHHLQRRISWDHASLLRFALFALSSPQHPLPRPPAHTPTAAPSSTPLPTLKPTPTLHSLLSFPPCLTRHSAPLTYPAAVPSTSTSGPAGSSEEATQKMDIVFVAAEVAPWSKTGGLGDVMAALPVALAKRGHRVMVVTPRYGEMVAQGWGREQG